MKKQILLGLIALSLVGCSNFIPREDLYEKVAFKSEEIAVGVNEIKLYSIEYPEEYNEKKIFLKTLERESKKILLANKEINILISEEFENDLSKFRKGEFLTEEELYIKLASDLDEFKKNQLDETIKVEVTKRGGDIQYYLNKQTYFWYEALGRTDEFDGEAIYTELDKQRLMEEVRESRAELFELLNAIEMNGVIEINNPLEEKEENTYWATKEIDLFNISDVSRKVQEMKQPIYLKNLTEDTIEKIVQSREDFESDIIFIESSKLKGYSVDNNKYTFYTGGNIKRGYYKGYDFETVVEEVKVEEMAGKDFGIALDDLLLKDKVLVNGIEAVEVKTTEKNVDWGIN